MSKKEAELLASKLTNEQILEMFKRAREGITDWTIVSKVNKSFTKGTAWNLLAKNFDLDYNYHKLAKKNMIWEFGDWLPEDLRDRPTKKKKTPPPYIHHQDPDFTNY